MSNGELRLIDWEEPHAGFHIVNDLHTIGFCVLRNHGLDMAGLDALRGGWRRWFKECGAKESYRHDFTQAGWFGREQAETPVGRPMVRDAKEYFQMFGSSIGQAPANLRGITREHFMEMNAFASSLAATIEAYTPLNRFGTDEIKELGLVAAIKDSPNTMLRVAYYPKLTEDEWRATQEHSIADVRAGEHTDVNLITLIPCNAERGLQVKTEDGWAYVPWHPSYLVVNAGDMLEKMSDGFYKSAVHRVVSPPYGEPSRMSLPFFVHPRSDVELQRGLTAGDFLQQRLRELGVI